MSAVAPTFAQPTVCPNGNHFRTSCKKRMCPVCGPRWARDWHKVMSLNLGAYAAPVIMVVITPPGSDRLPWDEHECRFRHKHGQPHNAKYGCRVEQRAAREWNETATWRYAMLRRAAMQHLRRLVKRGSLSDVPNLLLRVWEPQKRGVAHLHLVLGAGSREEIEAAAEFVKKLKELAPDYDFGFVDARGKLKKGMPGQRLIARGEIMKIIAPADAARYLSSYLTGRSRHKASIRESLCDPAISALLERGHRITSACKHCDGSGKAMGEAECYACRGSGKSSRKPVRQSLPLVWMTPRLTSFRRGGTGCTMRTLRRARHLWAAARGVCEVFPKWSDLYEAIVVGAVCRRAFPERGEGGQGPPLERLVDDAVALADSVMARIEMLPASGPNWRFRAQHEKQLPEFATLLALQVAGLKRKSLADALAVAA